MYAPTVAEKYELTANITTPDECQLIICKVLGREREGEKIRFWVRSFVKRGRVGYARENKNDISLLVIEKMPLLFTDPERLLAHERLVVEPDESKDYNKVLL